MVIVALLGGFWAGFHFVSRRPEDRGRLARAQVGRWAEKLDGETTRTGVYIRRPGETLPEADPWGHPLLVSYTQGGFAEALTVRSMGPDGIAYSDDDVFEDRHAANLKGAGEAIKDNVGTISKEATRGVIKGLKEELTPKFLRKEARGG
jgi:hypothetical protein